MEVVVGKKLGVFHLLRLMSLGGSLFELKFARGFMKAFRNYNYLLIYSSWGAHRMYKMIKHVKKFVKREINLPR